MKLKMPGKTTTVVIIAALFLLYYTYELRTGAITPQDYRDNCQMIMTVSGLAIGWFAADANKQKPQQ
jgi:hypothetical protein